jgi:hypothetical protein
MRFHAFLPSWDTFAICRILLHTFLMRCHVFLPFWDALVRLYAFCWTIIVRDTLMRCIFCAHTQRSCQIRVTSMYYIKSIRMFEDDVTWPEHAVVIKGGLGRWRNICNLKNVCPLWAVTVFWSGFFVSPFFSSALTVNVIGLFFLRQCFTRLPISTETSISGTSRKLPLCIGVSQYV